MDVELSEKTDTLKGGPNSKSDQNNQLEHNQVYNLCCTRGENYTILHRAAMHSK